ncbi:MAG: glycerophosphodiester phosphodiesterase [Alphaproteobacteria bacterium]|nr:glycerophosphodiester phosphodiesterase [Alphaproteobacteria bacterium]MCW5742087.1 glycerophosphodiester phosphodiesterase [Alphaproteobacteria bacterium]
MPLPSLELPRVIGHRGAATYAPENTLASLREARRRGATWVEFDVKLSADGVAMLMHDESLKRTAGLDRLASATSWTQISGLDAGSWMAPRYAGQRVPSFVEAIGCLGDEGLGANVEIKPCPGREAQTAQAAVEILRARWPAHLPTPLLSSFKDAALAAALEAAPEYPRAILIDELRDDWRLRAEAVGAIGVNTNGKKLTAGRAAEIKAAGYLLSVYTINDSSKARELVSMGVDCVITDSPDVILAALTG